MPGVTVTTAVGAGSSVPLRPASGQFFCVGMTERGDVTKPNLCRGMTDVARLLGNRVTYGYVWDALNTFFAEGGDQAWIGRVVGPTPTVGTLTLTDRAGTPASTVRIDAANPGAWSSNVQIVVLDGSLSNTFRVQVLLNGEVVEDHTNLANPAAAVSAFSTSPYVRATDLGSATSAPNNNPAVITATALSAGTDDRTNVTNTQWTNALAQFTIDYGDGAVALPGQSSGTLWTAVNDHCKANNRIGILASALGDSKSTLQGRVGDVDSEYCGLFAPWITVSDGSGGVRTIPPEGYVAAMRARAHDQVGAWRVPAGDIAKSNTLLGLNIVFSTTDADDLDNSKVNVIRQVAGTIRLYGWRSLSSDETNYAYLYVRDLLNRLVTQGAADLEQFVFATVDSKGQLLSAINAELVGMLDPIAKAGGLYALYDNTGKQIDPGYVVTTDQSVNPAQSLSQNIVNARVEVRVSPTGSLIALTIVKVGILSTFTS